MPIGPTHARLALLIRQCYSSSLNISTDTTNEINVEYQSMGHTLSEKKNQPMETEIYNYVTEKNPANGNGDIYYVSSVQHSGKGGGPVVRLAITLRLIKTRHLLLLLLLL